MLTKERLKEKIRVNDCLCCEIVNVLDIFSSRTRFRILCILREQDFCVSDIVEIIGESRISNISQQLRIMTMSGIISKYRIKKQVFYKLEDERIKNIVDFLHSQFIDNDKEGKCI